MKGRAFVYCQLPKAGLGNKLFVWAKALVFAKLNRLPLVVTGWTQFQLAPILIGGDFRFYWNYFRSVNEVNGLQRAVMRCRAKVLEEPPLTQFEISSQPTIYRFSKIPPWSDYFGDLKPHREMICLALSEMLAPARQRELKKASKTTVGIQIRMGDFRPLGEAEDFAKVGQVRTPLSHFIQLIDGIREIHGSQLPVTIFSDGNPSQLQEILRLPGVSLSRRQTAIVDILCMANSKVLIPSAGSTFGYWGGFLGNCVLILHPDHIHQAIRPSAANEIYFEGPAVGPPHYWPELLKSNIKSIVHN